MKKLLVVLMIVALVMVFASSAFAGVPGHPSGPAFGDLTRGIATAGPEAIFGAIRGHFGF